MEFDCHHDPAHPDHLICEMKHTPFISWFKKRWRNFYCVGPTCPAHKAYIHLWIDIFLAMAVISLLIVNLVLLSKGRINDSRNAGVAGLLSQEVESPVVPPGKENHDISPDDSRQNELSLQAKAFYFSDEGEQLGRGPWPPETGKSTRLKMAWKLPQWVTPAVFKDVSVTGKLSPNVFWTGYVPIGQGVTFRPSTGKVRWDVVSGETNAVFELEFRPDSTDIEKKEAVIMSTIVVRGYDTATQARVEILIPDVLSLW